MSLFWILYLLTGMAFSLFVMAKFSFIGKPIEIFKFFDAEKYIDNFENKIENLLLTIIIIGVCILGWPILGYYVWKDR